MDNIIDQLKRDEGVRRFPYKDSVGKLTIGVGRNLDDVGIFEEEIELMLSNDVKAAFAKLQRSYSWFITLDEVRQGVLINMTFNMGSLGQFPKMLACVESGDYSGAASEMLDSLWATQVGDRATRLSEQMKTGVWV